MEEDDDGEVTGLLPVVAKLSSQKDPNADNGWSEMLEDQRVDARRAVLYENSQARELAHQAGLGTDPGADGNGLQRLIDEIYEIIEVGYENMGYADDTAVHQGGTSSSSSSSTYAARSTRIIWWPKSTDSTSPTFNMP